MLGLNTLLISLGSPRNEIIKDVSPHRLTLRTLRLSEFKLTRMKDFIFDTIEQEAAGSSPRPPPRDELEWIQWGRSLVGRLTGSEYDMGPGGRAVYTHNTVKPRSGKA